MIVKNEERYLPLCLRSVQAVADELIVVDTGSRDSTVQVAQQFRASVHHFAWQQDFAAARNFAKQQASGRWILQIDADEELFPEDQDKLRRLVRQTDYDIVFLPIHNRTSSIFGENQHVIHYLPRLFRNKPELIYRNAIHENLVLRGKQTASDIRLLHHGYNFDAEKLAEKQHRNAELLLDRLRKHPDDPAVNFYLSQYYLNIRRYAAARKYALRVCELCRADERSERTFYLMALNNLATMDLEEDNLTGLQYYCAQALEADENYLVPLFLSAVGYFREERLNLAKRACQTFLQRYDELQRAETVRLYDHAAGTYRFQVYHLLGKILRREGDVTAAKQMFLKAVELNPQFWIGFADLGYVSAKAGDLPQAAAYLEKAFALAKANPAVREDQPALWVDFQNLCKTYVAILKKLQAHPQAAM